MREHDELAADLQEPDDLGTELVKPIGRDEIEDLPCEHEIVRARGVIDLEGGDNRRRLTRLTLRDGRRRLDLVDVHARPATGEEHDALSTQRPQRENLRLPVAKSTSE